MVIPLRKLYMFMPAVSDANCWCSSNYKHILLYMEQTDCHISEMIKNKNKEWKIFGSQERTIQRNFEEKVVDMRTHLNCSNRDGLSIYKVVISPADHLQQTENSLCNSWHKIQHLDWHMSALKTVLHSRSLQFRINIRDLFIEVLVAICSSILELMWRLTQYFVACLRVIQTKAYLYR